MKKLLSILLSIVLLFSSLSIGQLMSYAATSDCWNYTVSNGNATITNYNSYYYSGQVLTVPSKLNGYPVTKIGNRVFENCPVEVVLPSSIVEIGEYAFYDYYQYDSPIEFKLPGSCKKIGKHAFSFAHISSITIPSGVTTISQEAFAGSDLKTVTINSGVKTIEKEAFANCESLKSISIPNSVTAMGVSAFENCIKLSSVKLSSNVKTIPEDCFRNCKSLESLTIPSGVVNIGKNAFWVSDDYKSSLTSVKFPSTLTSIGAYAFYNTSISKVALNKGLKTIGEGAFEKTKISSLTVPSTVTGIGKFAFSCCSNLLSVSLPSGINSISQECFSNCKKLSDITISNGINTISWGAFAGTAIETLRIPKSVSSISYAIFGENGKKNKKIIVSKYNKTYSSYDGVLYNKDKTKLIYCPAGKTSIKFAKGVKSIGKKAFYASKITKITLPKSIATLGEGAFSNSALKTISIPGKVKTIPNSCFSQCYNLTNVKIPNSITKIGDDAFWATNISSIDLPNGLKSIGFRAIDSDSLHGITIPASVTEISSLWDPEGTCYDYIAGYKGTAAEKYAKSEGVKFIVAPTKGNLSSVSSPSKGKLKLKWKKVKGAAGYQIQISTSSTMSANTKSYTVKKGSVTAGTISKLTKGKKYYVQVRAYKKVKVKGKTRTVYGSWSSTKSIKIKK